MVQSKKKQRKNADFQKLKLKVGNSKQPPASSTSINLQSRKLIVPNQNPTNPTTTTTKSTLTHQYISQIRHPNAAARKNAVAGLAQLIKTNPEVLQIHFVSIVCPLLYLHVDPDPGVRAFLLSTIKVWLEMVTTTARSLQAVPELINVMCLAMNHVDISIRVHALDALEPWVESIMLFPHAHHKLLSNLIGLFQSQGSSSQCSSLGFAECNTRLRLCALLAKYLGSLYSHRSSSALNDLPRTHAITLYAPAVHFQSFSLSMLSKFDLSVHDESSSSHSFNLHSFDSVHRFLELLIPIISAFWIEASAVAFGKNLVHSSDALDLCLETLRVITVTLRFFHQEQPTPDLCNNINNAILRYISPYFPFEHGKQFVDPQVRLKVTLMTIHLIETLCRIGHPNHHHHDADQTYSLFDLAVNHFVAILHPPQPNKSSKAQSPFNSVSVDQFNSDFVPAIEVLPKSTFLKLVPALMYWILNLPPSNPTRMEATRFLCLRLSTQTNIIDTETCQQFSLALIRYVHELDASALDISVTVFRYLQLLLVSGQLDTFITPVINGISVYFFLPNKTIGGGRWGPWIRLPPTIQRLFLNMLHYLPVNTWPQCLVSAFERVVVAPITTPSIVYQALEMLRQHTSLPNALQSTFQTYLGTDIKSAYEAGPMDVFEWHEWHMIKTGTTNTSVVNSRNKRLCQEDYIEGQQEIMKDHLMKYIQSRHEIMNEIDVHIMPKYALHASSSSQSFISWIKDVMIQWRKLPTIVVLSAARLALHFVSRAEYSISLNEIAGVLNSVDQVIAGSDGGDMKHPLIGHVRDFGCRVRAIGIDDDAWEHAMMAARENN